MAENDARYRIINYCNENYNIRELYAAVTGREPGFGKCYCIFHQNTDTPAAKIYGNKLKCFGECNRLFGSYDILKRYFPEEIEKIKQSLRIPDIQEKRVKKTLKTISRQDLDLSSPISDIITKILNSYDED
jgi:hypothetical protein|nr:MAG TPA: hypothetical protein [Herelleviridae sp.]